MAYGEMQGTRVELSPAAIALAVLDGPRQRAFIKYKALENQLELMLQQVILQKVKVEAARRDYEKIVSDMERINKRNER